MQHRGHMCPEKCLLNSFNGFSRKHRCDRQTDR